MLSPAFPRCASNEDRFHGCQTSRAQSPPDSAPGVAELLFLFGLARRLEAEIEKELDRVARELRDARIEPDIAPAERVERSPCIDRRTRE